MTPLGNGWRRLIRLWRHAPARDVDAELAFHFDERMAELQEAGMDPAAARAQAEREFGDRAEVRARLLDIDSRAARRRDWRERWEWLGQDLRYVLRALRRSPGFVVTVVLTLALGLGANVAIFSILDRLFLSPPPGIERPDGIRRLAALTPPGRFAGSSGVSTQSVFSYPEFREMVAGIPSVRFTGYNQDHVTLADSGGSIPVGLAGVLGDYFSVLGVHPQLGRFFTPDELRPAVPTFVTVLGDRLWRQRFGASSAVIGRTIRIDDRPFTVIGVAAPEFHGAENDAADVWVPMNAEEMAGGGKWFEGNNTFWIHVMARPPATLPDTRFAAIASNVFRHSAAPGDTALRARIGPLMATGGNEFDSREMRIATHLSGVALLLLLISCANIANLLLARGMYRRRELGMRVALGISRGRLMTLLLLESVSVTVLGAAAGLALAWWGADLLRHMLLPGVRWVDATVNGHVLLFTVGIALVTGLLAGTAPAWQLSRPDVVRAVRGGSRNPAHGRTRTRAMLLIAQTALSVMLLAATGLFLRSLHRIATLDIGYDTDQAIFVDISPTRGHEAARTDIRRRLPLIADELRQLPGVQRTALAEHAPMLGIGFVKWYEPGRDTTGMFGPDGPYANEVGPGFFAAMGMHLLRGREIAAADRRSDAGAIIVNAEMAKRLWPGADPLTRCLVINMADGPCRPVVGVVSNGHAFQVIEGPSMQFYLPVADTGGATDAGVVIVRAAPGQAARVVTAIIRELTPRFAGLATVDVRRMNDYLDLELRPWRTGALLFTVAGLLALLVAAVGIYSAISYAVSQQLREVGVRMALGAQRRQLVALVVGQGIRTVLAGTLIGVALACAGGQLVASMLYQTSPRDPAVLTLVAVVLLVVAVLAALIPAVRATRVDPAITLRAE